MAASFNRVIFAGNLTRDPELSYLPSGTPVCRIGIAANRKWRDKDGNQKEETCFVDANAFARQAEVINQYLRKGQGILIEGRLKYRQWTDKSGQNRSKLDIVIENFQFTGGPRPGGEEGGYGNQQRGGYSRPAPAGASNTGYGSTGPGGYGGAAPEPMDEPPPMDDAPPPSEADIPF
jgi:single-strand DNA-binding protein